MDSHEFYIKKNIKYVVIFNYSFMGSVLNKGDVVELSEQSYDPKLGVYRFWMKNTVTGVINVFHVDEDDINKIDIFQKYFSQCERH